MTQSPSAAVPLASNALGPRPLPPLRSNVRWTLIASVAASAGNWLVLVALARASGSAALGVYAYALALTAPVIGSGSFTALQIRMLIASDPARRYGFHEYRWASLAGSVVGLLAMPLVLLVGGDVGGLSVMAPLLVMRVGESLTDTYFGLWQLHERMRTLAIARLVQIGVTVPAVFVATQGLALSATGAALSAALGTLAALAFIHAASVREPEMQARRRGAPVSARRVARIMLQGVPLGFIVLLGVLQANVPRYFIGLAASSAALGFFAAASQLTTSGNMVVAAVGAAAVPRLAGWYAAGDARFWQTTRRLAFAGLLMGAAGVALSALLGRQILVLIYGAEFATARDTLVALSVAATAGFLCSLLGHAMTAARIIRPQPIILLVALGVLVVAAAILVPRHGGVGAAWALTCAGVVQAGASYAVLRDVRRRHEARAPLTPPERSR